MDTERLIKLIINTAYEVRSHLVAGYLESVYKKALLLPAHEIQLVNYLTIAEIDNGLLINFGAAERLEIKRKYRVYNPHI